MRGSRATGVLAAVLAVTALVLAVHTLRVAPHPDLVTRWWPTTALMTVAVFLSPRRQARTLIGALTLIVLVASLLSGRGVVFSVGFAIANAAEALIVVRLVAGFTDERPELRSWMDYRRWLLAIAVGSLAAAGFTVLTLAATGTDELWRPLTWVAMTHFAAQSVALPLAMRQPGHRARISAAERVTHVCLVALGAWACFEADESEPVAFLMLPLLMWAAARFTHQWANLELLGVATLVVLLTAEGRGPFTDVTGQATILDLSASAPTFLAVSAVTSVAFSVAMTHLRDSLRRLRQNELQLGQLLDSASGTAFIATDLDGMITWFSPGAEQLLGYSGNEVVNRITPVPFHDSRELEARAQELGVKPGYHVVTDVVAHGAEQDTRDWTYVRKDGSRLTVSLSVTAARDDDGRAVSFLNVVRDVTDRRAAEQALVFALDKERETNQRMLELDRAKGEFVSAVSHELRTPLTSIVGYTEILADADAQNLSEMQRQLVERIDRNGSRLLHLVEDLLTLARVEDGSLSLDRVPTDLCEAVRAATDEVAHRAHQGRVTLRVNVPREPVMVEGDMAHLERLVLNLASNAVKFTPEAGRVEVSVHTLGDVAEVRVSDTGMGIPLEEQGRLFQRFFRSSLATEHAIQGTGLGLHIVRSIAEAHDGRIDFESSPGVGTTFRFTVPLMPEDLEDPGPDQETGEEPDEARTVGRHGGLG